MSGARRGHEKGVELTVNVLFVCVGNAGRSPMAEAFFRLEAGGRYEVRSAGTRPAIRMGPNVVEVMRELGIDLSGHQPRQLERSDLEWADVVVRIGCGDACPVIPGRRYFDWEVQDPNETDPETTRRIRDEISSHVGALLAELDGEAGRRAVLPDQARARRGASRRSRDRRGSNHPGSASSNPGGTPQRARTRLPERSRSRSGAGTRPSARARPLSARPPRAALRSA